MVTWRLSKQGLSWPVSHDHIEGPCLELITVACSDLSDCCPGTSFLLDFSPKPVQLIIVAPLPGLAKSTMVKPTLVLRLEGSKALDINCDFTFQGKILSSSYLTQTLNVGQVFKMWLLIFWCHFLLDLRIFYCWPMKKVILDSTEFDLLYNQFLVCVFN